MVGLDRILNYNKNQIILRTSLRGVTGDIDKGTVFVSPKGDIIELPIGATALDFAFAVLYSSWN